MSLYIFWHQIVQILAFSNNLWLFFLLLPVSQFSRYILREVTWKLCLQEKSLRELAAEALSFLVKYDPQYFASTVMEKLIPCTLSSDLCMRHGATLATGELVLALHQCNFALPSG